MTGTYIRVLKHLRNCSHFVFWADNCSGQNKNWTLFSNLALAVNEDSGPESVTIKFLTTGHTFFAADGIHGKIEQAIRKKNLDCECYRNSFHHIDMHQYYIFIQIQFNLLFLNYFFIFYFFIVFDISIKHSIFCKG